ncbi:DUF6898 family protein [Maricaulis parjimensis]|uniref:DUF6898 family protein n=1 Tax=Maricaulis parjimensis TaxID=144023 RepID=UPI0019393797|nr:hypothetical protein [Maricaulis parjimensis]
MSGEIYIEIIGIGNALRVAAIDADTAEEVVFQVPKNTPRAEVEYLAKAKLNWKLNRNTDKKKRPDTGSGRGITV